MRGHLSTRVCDLLDCKYPVVLAGMGGVARSELVAAITNAGGFGFLRMVREPPSLIRETLLTDMFHINWPIGAPHRTGSRRVYAAIRSVRSPSSVRRKAAQSTFSAPTRRCAR